MNISYLLLVQIDVREIADGVLLSIDLRERDGQFSDTVVGPLYYKTENDALDSTPRLVREARRAIAERRLKREQERCRSELNATAGVAGGNL